VFSLLSALEKKSEESSDGAQRSCAKYGIEVTELKNITLP